MKAPGPITIASRRSRSSAVLTYNRVRSGRLVARALGCSVLDPAPVDDRAPKVKKR